MAKHYLAFFDERPQKCYHSWNKKLLNNGMLQLKICVGKRLKDVENREISVLARYPQVIKVIL